MKTPTTKKQAIIEAWIKALADLKTMRFFIPPAQMRILRDLVNPKTEECEFFHAKVAEYAKRIAEMPAQRQQDGKGDASIVYLHYMAGSQADVYLIEKDTYFDEEYDDPATKGQQNQAYGLVDLFGDGGELGYVHLPEVFESPYCELDLHFTPITLGELRAKREERLAA